MFKTEIVYEDFNGESRAEDFYFHMSTPEIIRMEAEVGEDLEEHIRNLAKDGDAKTLLDFLEKIILGSYGKRTTDGKSFIKSVELRREFEYSNAYAELFERVLTDSEFTEKFAQSIVSTKKAPREKFQPKVLDK